MTDVEGEHSIWGTWAYCGMPGRQRLELRERFRDRDHKAVYLNILLNYANYPRFDLRDDLPRFRSRCEELYAVGLFPVLNIGLADGVSHRELLDSVGRFLPDLRDHVVAAFSGWELAVDGSPTFLTGEEHLKLIEMADRELPGVVLGVEFGTPANRREPITFDGRVSPDHVQYWAQTAAARLDVLQLEIGYAFASDRRMVADEVGGAIARWTGRFDHARTWPDGSPIDAGTLGNWDRDLQVGRPRVVSLFEYAAFSREASARKRALREFVQSVVPLTAWGEG